jgi:hypothetical protein
MKRKMFAALGVTLVSMGLLAGSGVPAQAGAAPISVPIQAQTKTETEKVAPLSTAVKKQVKKNKPVVGSDEMKTLPDDPEGPKRSARASSCSANPDGSCHQYAGMYQYISNGTNPIDGAGFRQEVGKPTVRSWDYFSLLQDSIEMAGPNGRNIVEAGWVVNPALFSGSLNPHFFVSSWAKDAHLGWGTGFVPVSSPIMTHGTDVNSIVGDGVGFRTYWEHHDSTTCSGCEGWWLYYAKAVGDPLTPIGYYHDSVWTSLGETFEGTDVTLVQWFGETAASQRPSQTGMGQNSLLTTNRIGTSALSLTGPSAPTENPQKNTACVGAAITAGLCDFSKWDATLLSTTAFNIGGPGGFEDIISTVSPTNDCSGEGTGTNPSGLGALCTYSTQASNVPSSAIITQIDMSAGTACRGNVGTSAGYAPIRNVALTGVKKATFWANGTCTGAGTQLNHGRIVLPAGLQAQANLSYRIDSTYATCATGWPTTAPTC